MKNIYALTYNEKANGFAVLDIMSLIERQCDYICNELGDALLVVYLAESKEECELLQKKLMNKKEWKSKITNHKQTI